MASVSLLALHLLQVPVHLQDSAGQTNVGFNAGQVQATLPQCRLALCSKFCQATEMIVLSAAAPCFE